MFILISLLKEKSDFSEEKHFFNKNNLRTAYGGVFHGRIFLWGERERERERERKTLLFCDF